MRWTSPSSQLQWIYGDNTGPKEQEYTREQSPLSTRARVPIPDSLEALGEVEERDRGLRGLRE